MQIPKGTSVTTQAGPSNSQKGKARVLASSPKPVSNNNRRNGESQAPLPEADERFARVTYLQNGRIDTYQLKSKLTEYLGNNASMYWVTLKRLIYCKIRRIDFDRIVRPLFDKEHLDLHNMLLFGIFRNCLNKEGPPPQPESHSKKRGRDGDEETSVSAPDSKRKRLKEIIMGLPKDERERIKDIAKALHSFTSSTSLPPPKTERLPRYDIQDGVFRPQSDGMHVPTCAEQKALPDHRALFGRLNEIAHSNGLKNVSEDCVQLMNYALESHLKNILGNCIQKTRSGSSALANGNSARIGRMYQDKTSITGQDMAFSLDMSPHILVEPSLARERLTSVVLDDNEVCVEDEDGIEESAAAENSLFSA
ncbi:12805_t:CDS:2 [Funneliformis caledonium]|uniref:12805_t:CDS:1 n=1 Tax=Funneliformis caledonium TaxID=1117310 RepID=A0A9N9DKN4_9GLOM|nr:12805_t:CDS:2 [Funneliformis caledonium]